MIHRIHKTENYTVMCNEHLQNKKLSLKAKGLLSIMLSLPDSWDYSVEGLTKLSRDGRDAINNAISELKDNGYIKVSKIRSADGRWDVLFDIYECSQNHDGLSVTDLPQRENRNGLTVTENPQELSTYSASTYQQSTKDKVLDVPKQTLTARGYAGIVMLTDYQYDKLSSKYGKDAVEDCISRCEDWCIKKKHRCQDYYRTLNNWLRKDVETGTLVIGEADAEPKEEEPKEVTSY